MKFRLYIGINLISLIISSDMEGAREGDRLAPDDGTDSEGHIDVDLERLQRSGDTSGSQNLSSASCASSFSSGRSPRISGVSHSLPHRRVPKITSKTKTSPRRFIRHSARESGVIAQDGRMRSPLLPADDRGDESSPEPGQVINDDPEVPIYSIAKVKHGNYVIRKCRQVLQSPVNVVLNRSNLTTVLDELGTSKVIIVNVAGSSKDRRRETIITWIEQISSHSKKCPSNFQETMNMDENLYMWLPVFTKIGEETVGVIFMSMPHLKDLALLRKMLKVTNCLASTNVILEEENGTADYFETYFESGMTHNLILIFGADVVAAGQEQHDLEDKARQKAQQLIDKVYGSIEKKNRLKLHVYASSCYYINKNQAGLHSFLESHLKMGSIKRGYGIELKKEHLHVHVEGMLKRLNAKCLFKKIDSTLSVALYLARLVELVALCGLLHSCNSGDMFWGWQYLVAILILSKSSPFIKDIARFICYLWFEVTLK